MSGMELFKAFGEALAIGLLIGSERYKGREEGEIRTAGVRTYAIICLLGAASSVLDQPALTAVTFAALALLIALGYYRISSRSFGLTSEMAALLTFWIGYLMLSHEALAISTGIVVVIFLAAKKALHNFVREQVTEEEFYDTLKFLAVVFVIFPLLPNQYLGPFDFFNPTQVWGLIIVVSAISYVGYILMRLLGSGRGLLVSSLLGGVVSTLAVTLSLAQRAREAPALSRICGVIGVMANSVQFPRLLFLVWLVDPAFAAELLLPLLGMGLVGFLGSYLLSRTRLDLNEDPKVDPVLENPFSLTAVLKFGLFFVAVFFITKAARAWFGAQGIIAASAIAGLGSVSAIALSLADLVRNAGLSEATATAALLIALASNALMKWVVAYFNGNREVVFWLGGGFLTMLAAGGLIFLFLHDQFAGGFFGEFAGVLGAYRP